MTTGCGGWTPEGQSSIYCIRTRCPYMPCIGGRCPCGVWAARACVCVCVCTSLSLRVACVGLVFGIQAVSLEVWNTVLLGFCGPKNGMNLYPLMIESCNHGCNLACNTPSMQIRYFIGTHSAQSAHVRFSPLPSKVDTVDQSDVRVTCSFPPLPFPVTLCSSHSIVAVARCVPSEFVSSNSRSD